MEILTHRQGEPEWEEWRRMFVGASDAPVIMQDSPYKTPYRLFLEKAGLEIPKVNASMTYGRNREAYVRDRYESESGYKVYPRCAVHSEIHWMIASFDGITLDKSWIVELKCANKEDHRIALEGRVPDKYWAQVQHQLEVANLERMHYVSFHEGDLAIVDVERNPDYIERLIKTEFEFYEMVLTRTPPFLTDRDFQKRDDDEWSQVAAQWREISIERKHIEAQERLLAAKLKELAAGSPTEGNGVRVSQITRRGGLNEEELSKVVDLNTFRKPDSAYWKLEQVGGE